MYSLLMLKYTGDLPRRVTETVCELLQAANKATAACIFFTDSLKALSTSATSTTSATTSAITTSATPTSVPVRTITLTAGILHSKGGDVGSDVGSDVCIVEEGEEVIYTTAREGLSNDEKDDEKYNEKDYKNDDKNSDSNGEKVSIETVVDISAVKRTNFVNKVEVEMENNAKIGDIAKEEISKIQTEKEKEEKEKYGDETPVAKDTRQVRVVDIIHVY